MLDAWLGGDWRKVAALIQAHTAETLDDLRQQLAPTTRATAVVNKWPRSKKVPT